MGSFSLISVGAGSCPNSAKQPPTLQNKYREAYGYCQGNRWIFIWFVKELETACCILIQRLFQATGIVWKQGQLQHGQQRQQKQAWMRLGYKGEGKPDTKLRGVLEMRRKSSAKYVKEVEGKLNMFVSKRLCGGFCQGWREQDGPLVGALGTGRCPSRCRRLHHGCCWDLPPFSPLPGMWLQRKAARTAPLAQGTVLSGGRGSWGCHTQQRQADTARASRPSHLWRAVN